MMPSCAVSVTVSHLPLCEPYRLTTVDIHLSTRSPTPLPEVAPLLDKPVDIDSVRGDDRRKTRARGQMSFSNPTVEVGEYVTDRGFVGDIDQRSGKSLCLLA